MIKIIILLQLLWPSVFFCQKNCFTFNSNHNFFLYGEVHDRRNIETTMLLVKAVSTNKKHVNIFIEYNSALQKHVDYFLTSGDTTYLKKNILLDVASKNTAKDFFLQLYQYKKELQTEKELHVYCVDIETYYLQSLYELLQILKESNEYANVTIKEDKALIEKNYFKLFGPGKKKISKVVKKLHYDLVTNEGQYKSILKHDYSLYKRILEGCLVNIEMVKRHETLTDTLREKFIFDNINTISKSVGIIDSSVSIGIFGRFHVSKSLTTYVDKKYKPLGNYLNSDPNSIYRNTVYSIYNIFEEMDKCDSGKTYGIFTCEEMKRLYDNKTKNQLNITCVKSSDYLMRFKSQYDLFLIN